MSFPRVDEEDGNDSTGESQVSSLVLLFVNETETNPLVLSVCAFVVVITHRSLKYRPSRHTLFFYLYHFSMMILRVIFVRSAKQENPLHLHLVITLFSILEEQACKLICIIPSLTDETMRVRMTDNICQAHREQDLPDHCRSSYE